MAYGAVWDVVSASSLATRPSVYVNFESLPPAPMRDLGGRMAMISTADFGPVGEKVDLLSPADVDHYLGAIETNLTRAIKEAFYQGASRVSFYRVAGAGPVKATLTLATAALVVTAKYEGTYGNEIKAEVVTNAADAAQKDLNIYVGTTKVATYTGATAADILADWTSQEANGIPPDWSPVTLSAPSGTPSNVVATALTGGANGAAPAAGDYTAAMDDMSAFDFTTVAFDTTDTGIQVSIKSWVAAEREAGHRIFAVLAPAAGLTWSAKKTQVALLNDEGTIYLANGWINRNGVTFDPVWAAVADAAQIAAFRTRSITYAPIVGATGVTEGLTALQYGEALTQGLLVHSWDGEKVKFEQGLNTLQPGAQVAPKGRDWRKIRFMFIQDEFIKRAGRQLGDNFIGQVSNDSRGRAEAVRQVRQIVNQMLREGLFNLDEPVVVEQHPSYVSDEDRVFIRVEAKIVDAIEKLFLTLRV